MQLDNNDVGLYDTSSRALYIQWYQLIPHKGRP